MLRSNWKLFLGITLIYAILTILFVRGLSSAADVENLKKQFGDSIGPVGNGLLVFALLAKSSGSNASQVAGVYQTMLAIIVSLAVIWALRQVFAGTPKIRIRDSFYRGMYPLVPVLLVLLVIGLQLLPMVVGASLYGTIVSQGIASGPAERSIFGFIALLLSAWSVFMIISSVFALYIAALPEMTPMNALRSARGLVRYRRWTVLRKLLLLPLCLLVTALAVMLPIILSAPALASWALLFLTMTGLPIAHAYIYTLYRELLK